MKGRIGAGKSLGFTFKVKRVDVRKLMKKLTYKSLLLVLLFLLAACSTNNPDGESGRQPMTKERPIVEGVNDVDVLNTHGRIEGIEKMQDFYDTIMKGIASDLRIVHYTEEGDPIVTDLRFNGDSLEVEHDSTRDSYGRGEIRTTSCADMIVDSTPTRISYIAIDCSGIPNGKDEILQINFNLSEQDYFELELKYGVNLENEINTITNKAIKEITATETLVMNDFDLSEDVMQEVYKRLVFANYLAEKELEATCENEDAMEYDLKVYINGGQRDYRWSECDQGVDGAAMTEIVEYIIAESEKVLK